MPAIPYITTANAKELAAKSVQARREKRALPVMPLLPDLIEQDVYRMDRLKRVRMQLDNLDRLILAERDPVKLDRFASAQARLAEQERILAGRPLPGSYRPNQRKAKQTRPDIAPLPDNSEATSDPIP